MIIRMETKFKRPKRNTVWIQTLVAPADKEKLIEIARAREMNLSEVMRFLIRQEHERLPQAEPGPGQLERVP